MKFKNVDEVNEMEKIKNKAEAEYNGFEYDGENDELVDSIPYNPDEIRISQKMISLFQINRWIDNKSLDLRPEFQRNFVWNRQKQSLLIESLILNIPIPAFYLDENRDGNKSVIDGLQRLTTINNFLNDKFKLKGMQYLKQYNGCCFSELEKKYQMRIEDTQLAVNILDAICPEMVKFDVFRRINTGGISLNYQEIRNILSNTHTRKLLLKMSECKEFKDATQNRIRDIRMGAQEICLRFLTYYHSYDINSNRFMGFEEMNKMLDHMIIDLNKMTEEELQQNMNIFKNSMVQCHKLLEDVTFKKNIEKLNINRALFTSWSVVVSKSSFTNQWIIDNKEKVRKRYLERINNDEELKNAISYSTCSKKNMKYQFDCVKEILGV